MKKSVVITQSNYIPWRGYFDMLRSADQVILLDSVQYTRRDWRNRNRIKTSNGPVWLTIPVEAKGRYNQAIDETLISDTDWANSHLRSIELAYRRAPHFNMIFPELVDLLRDAATELYLTKVNERLIRAICQRLGIDVPITRCSEVLDRVVLRTMEPTQRLLELCLASGATRYLSGPAAKAYLDVSPFSQSGIEVDWMDYSGYSEYPQLWGGFDPTLSIIDLLLNTGLEAGSFLKRPL
ncbi:WbqC family protein [Microvirga sp. TS319]|uniref:WbqC family protein n=1 Tax=Microvirga sp. TS319 TaxID=3241165 RepID=UPI00351AA5F3